MPINDIIAEQGGTMATASEAARGGDNSSSSSDAGTRQSQPAARGPTLTLNGVTYDRDDMVFAMMAAQTILLVLLVMRL